MPSLRSPPHTACSTREPRPPWMVHTTFNLANDAGLFNLLKKTIAGVTDDRRPHSSSEAGPLPLT